MNEPVRKRTSAWKILGIVVGVILLSIVALIVWAAAAGSRKVARMQERSRVHLAAVKAADGRRPVLRGDAQEGNAWEDYALAQAEARKFPQALRLGEIVDRSPKADPELAKAALAAHAVAIDHLRRGAGRASSCAGYEWEQGHRMHLPPMVDFSTTANLALLQARALVAEGKSRDAAGVLLDVCQYGRDQASDGVVISYMVGTAILANAFTEIKDHLAAGKFDKAALEDLDRGLKVLEGSFPRYGQVIMNEALLFTGGLLDESADGGGGPMRLVYADGVEKMSYAMAATASTESLPWAEARKEIKRIETEAQDSWNPISRMTIPSLSTSGRVGRQRLAQLRLLREAVHWSLSGQLLDLEDPFGAKLSFQEKAGKLKIWSIGPDGVDDGGAGDWKSHLKDIPLEINR